MTLGPTIAAIALVERIPYSIARPFETLGRVPLFYYVLHLALIHLLAVAFTYARSGDAGWMFKNPSWPVNILLPFPEGYGFGLAAVYTIWMGVLLLLYPMCQWFANVKRRRRDWWLSYL